MGEFMVYQEDDIKLAQKVFYYLLEHHELREEEEPELSREYLANETGVQNIVKMQADASNCEIKAIGKVIYLIPKEDNYFLGYSKSQLKKELCRSNPTDKDYYLAQFIILVLLLEFYDGQGTSSKTRDFLRVGTLQNSITAKLQEGASKYSEDEQAEQGIAFTAMMEVYESLKSDEKGRRQKTTKEGFIYSILRFLEAQGLIDYIEQDEMIKTTDKLDSFMDWELLNKTNYSNIQKVLGVKNNEQN
ncbi:MAG: DUF6063 family protein [Phascolarctobacterium sp.]|nr:DUF6063 family protein [Phascolarctobacterium sp.]